MEVLEGMRAAAQKHMQDVARWYASAVKMSRLVESCTVPTPKLELPPSASCWASGLSSHVNLYIKLPWDTVLVDQVICAFTNLGWKLKSEGDFTAQSKYREYVLGHSALEDGRAVAEVRVLMSADLPGSKCRVVQAGVKTIPTFRVECDDRENV